VTQRHEHRSPPRAGSDGVAPRNQGAPGPDELNGPELSLRVAVERIRRGRLSSEAYTASLLEHIRRLEPHVRAFAWIDAETALTRARDADRAGAAGLLAGIPVGVKDIIDTAGIPTALGSPVFQGRVPERSAEVVCRLETEGGFVFGKTVTAELAYFQPGPTRNPWNPAHTPGGSSMGSAAAVAAGMVPLALGSQTNGSVIRPAAFCGCVGFKPSAGLISLAGVQAFSPTLDQLGVFVRSAEDAALALAALIGPDGVDSAGGADAILRANLWPLTPMSRPPRLLAVRTPVWSLAEPHAQAHFAETIARLRAAGAAVEETELPAAFEAAHAVQRAIMYAEGARTLAELQARHRGQLSAVLNRLIDEGRAISDAQLGEACERRRSLQVDLARFLRAGDAIVTLPACGEAPATQEHTGDPAFCTIWTLCGVPAITLPSGRGPHGLPLGLQVAGAFREDALLLRTAHWLAAALNCAQPLPDAPGSAGGAQP